MKKKGLIIATIVMVLVLAVSLTTATYAWFTNSGSATVSNISFAVGTAADIMIGVEVNNTYDSTANASNFYADATSWDSDEHPNQWYGDTNGLGLSIDTGVDLSSMQKAVYSFTGVDLDATPKTGTATTYTKGSGTAVTTGIDTTKTVLKGAGNGNSVDPTSYESAVVNTDYLQVAFGAAAAKADVLAFGCMVYVKPTDSKATLGLNAAIHVAYKLEDASSWTELDVYGSNSYSTTKSGMTAPTLPTVTISEVTKSLSGSSITPAKGDAYVWIPMYTAANSTAYATQDQIKQIQLLIYICGPDDDCITSATGVASTISIEFLSLNATQYAQ